jgi:hypothetical protein
MKTCAKCGLSKPTDKSDASKSEFYYNANADCFAHWCRECTARTKDSPIEDIAAEFPEYNGFDYHQKQVSDAIYARRKIRVVKERVEGLPPEQWAVWKYDATTLDEMLWKTK